jgi:Ner family transcriptional regulator
MVKSVELPSLPASTAPFSGDWHPADIAAALKKRGHSLAGLSIDHGYHQTAVGKALKQPWPAVEWIIAKALGTTPQTIWPSRYNEDGTPAPNRRTEASRSSA